MQIAYSYIRYSSGVQADGDSIRRQTEIARSWCERNAAELNTTTTYADHGKSAFRGKHRETGVLAAFLADIEQERIPRGSFLVVENLDRLSRESPWDAVPLLCSIVNAGVSVVTMSPSEMVYKRGRDLTPLILAVVEFGRANSESETKSGRGNENWTEKKRKARDEGEIVTHRLPAWVQERGGKLVGIPERVKVVRLMFDLATAGYGLSRIVKRLTTDRVPTWGRGEGWSKQYVHKILTGRTVLGEYQPMKAGAREDGTGKKVNGYIAPVPDGEPVKDYYPVVMDARTWDKTQAALRLRKDRAGRVGEKVTNLFTGLLTDAKTRGKLLIAWQTRGSGKNRQKVRTLVSAESMEGRAPSTSFPYPIFEEAILTMLKEVKTADVIGEEPPSESTDIAAELADTEGRIRKIEEALTGEDDDIPALVRVLKTMDEKRQDLLRRLTLARQKEANPQSQAWAEAKSLFDTVRDEAPRMRLRGLLQTIIEGVRVLIVAQKSQRLALVQINFYGGRERKYLIHSQAAARGVKGERTVTSFVHTPDAESLDLRKPEDVTELETVLIRHLSSTKKSKTKTR